MCVMKCVIVVINSSHKFAIKIHFLHMGGFIAILLDKVYWSDAVVKDTNFSQFKICVYFRKARSSDFVEITYTYVF